MRKLIIAGIFLLLVCFNGHAEFAESVSIVQLIANPAEYNGKKVIITGFLNMEFEGNGIYLHKDDYLNSVYKNGFWCNIDIVEYAKFNKKYIVIEGIFDAKKKGHLGLWSGTIMDISRVWEPVKGSGE